ncbi:TraB/GumN family protein [Cribrihabitans neustonicus]|uniref:TraB/GumN family protein n=1 Tax=Cribrihabitans neustonicus TaxID=1429085 RepID=UPI003B58B63B
MRIVVRLLLFLLPAPLWAACSGTDLREVLSPAERAEISTRVAALPYSEGNHWIAARGERRVHVIGTLHLNDPRMEAITTRLAPVIGGADALLVEADAEAEARFLDTLARDPSLTLITEGPTLIDRLPEADWQVLAEKARRHGIPPWMAAKMQPWFLSLSMAVPPCLRAPGAAPEPGLDKRLEAQADAAGVPVAALEDPLTLLGIMASDPLEDQVRELHAMLALLGTDGDAFHTMTESYFDEQAAFFLELSRRDFLAHGTLPRQDLERMWQDTLTAMTDVRNRAWLPVIEATEGTHIVVAAGALHLPGDNGLLNLLARAGYRLARAPF